jgi:membrane-associated phospholipid phosphatase
MRTPSLLLSVALFLLPASALAQSTPARDLHLAMGGSLAWDVGYVAVGGGLALAGLFASPPTIDRAPFDGLGGRVWRPEVGLVSDVVLWGGLAATVGLGVVVERWGLGSRGLTLLRAPLVLAESTVMTIGLVSSLKVIVGECRPRAWSDAEGRCATSEREDRVSFPSGHTASLAAMAGASLGMMLLPSGGRRAYGPILVASGALAVTNLVLRVVAGAHNWVDTSVGLVLGLGVGFGTAAAHVYEGPRLVVSAQGVGVAGTF